MKREKIEEFVVDFRPQTEWGWLVVIAFFLAGIGSGLFFMSQLVGTWAKINSPAIGALGVAIVAIGTSIVFITDLGRWGRFWRVLANPATSWISRGVLLIILFTLFAALTLLAQSGAGMPWSDTSLGQVFRTLAFLAAFGVMAYSGFVLSFSPAIPFWNGTLLPLFFILYALMGGLAAIFASLPFLGQGVNLPLLEVIEFWLIISAIAFFSIYLLNMGYSTAAARRAVRLLLKGELALTFLGGVLVLGLIVPLAITLFVYLADLSLVPASTWLAIAGAFELFGGVLFRHTFIRAGIYEPLS